MNRASTRCTSSRRAAKGETSKIPLAGKSAFYFEPEMVARQQAHRVQRQSDCNLWDVEVASGKLTKVDTDYYLAIWQRDFAWSGDSKWIAFSQIAAEPAARRVRLLAR